MRLVNVGPGELTDRLTILALKILHGSEAGKDVAHFETERTALLQQVRSRTLNGVWFEQVLQLGAVNAALWTAEDELRDLRAAEIKRLGKSDLPLFATLTEVELRPIAQVAFRIQALNDQRAALVQQINKDAGEATGQEKL
jgi:hypothetical protein